jgi:hypothetical protein
VDTEAAEYINRIAALSGDHEVKLLEDIQNRGYDQGSFLRPAPDQLLPVGDPDVTEAIFEAVADRSPSEAKCDDPFEKAPVEPVPIPGTEPGYVIATQRCDLVRPLVTEPFVELVYTELWHEKQAIDAARKLSNRFIYIADHEEGGAWVADLRRRATLAKDCLTQHDAVLAIDAGRMRKRFKLRLGQRYTRDVLPGAVAKQLDPLMTFLRKNATNMKLTEPFTDLLAFRKDDKLEIVAVCPAGTPQKAADDAWQAVEDALPDDYVEENIHEDSRALPMEEASIVFLLDGWTLDAGDISVNRKAGPDHEDPVL